MLFVEEVVDGSVMPRSNLKEQWPWECVTLVAEILYSRDPEANMGVA